MVTYLLRSGDELDHFLQSPCSVLVQSNLHHLRRSAVDEQVALPIIRMLKELLAKIIAEWIW